jgi:hypothetical protein
MTTDRTPAVRTADYSRPLVQFDRQGFPLVPLPEADQLPGSGAPEQHVHIHHHYPPEVPAPEPSARNPEAGWLLLNRLVPYLVAAALIVFLVGGVIAILAYVFTFVLAFLVVLIHSLVAITTTVIGLVAVVGVVAALIAPHLSGPSTVTTIHGNRNKIGAE